MSEPVRYHVLHETRYDYGSPVSLSQQQLHLSPRILAWQQVEEQRIDLDPAPTWRRDAQDAFGNPVSWVAFHAPHEMLFVSSSMRIAILPHLPPDLEQSLPWNELRDRLAYDASAPTPADLDATRFLFESPYIRVKHELAAYAADCFPPGRPVLVGTRALMAKIFKEFKFDPEATTVATPVLEVLANKRGVCQDFAHLMIGCLRALGLAARYVSGYLLTDPPPGQPRLVGADASHAWVSVWCGEAGWGGVAAFTRLGTRARAGGAGRARLPRTRGFGRPAGTGAEREVEARGVCFMGCLLGAHGPRGLTRSS